jgi:hypothetical protein
MNSLLDDKRKIELIEVAGGDVYYSEKGKIVPYREAGEMGYVPWFEIWEGNNLKSRINGRFVVAVMYEYDDA